MREIMYVIDHRLAGRQDWRRPDLSTGRVEATDDQAAAKELFDRADLAGSWAAQGGRAVRVRVWSDVDWDDVLAFDPAAVPAGGEFIYSS